MKKIIALFASAALALSSFSQVPFQTSRAIITSNEIVGAAAGSTPVTELETTSTSTSSPRGIMSSQFNTGTDGARFHGRKARGTRASPLVVVTGDNLTRWVGSGYDGSSFLEMASIIFGTEGTIASTRVPTNITFQTATNAAPSVLTSRLKIDSSGVFTFHPDAPGATITASASGEFAIAAAGTNQNITLTPSGTGFLSVKTSAMSSAVVIGAHTTGLALGAVSLSGALGDSTIAGLIYNAGTTYLQTIQNNPLIFRRGSTEMARFAGTTSNLLLGGLTTDGTGILQFPAATTNAGGIAFGTDVEWFRSGAGAMTFNGPSTNADFKMNVTGVNTLHFLATLSNATIQALNTAGGLVLQTGSGGTGATALTLDTSQNATFAGTIKSSGFARVTGDATNATATMANLGNLAVTVVAGTKYVGTIQLFANDSTAADGLAFDLGGGGATFTDLEFGFAAQPTGATLGTVTSTTSTTPVTLTVVSTSDAVYTVSFGFTCNAGGTFIPRFAQNSHSAGTATVRKNSGIITLASTN